MNSGRAVTLTVPMQRELRASHNLQPAAASRPIGVAEVTPAVACTAGTGPHSLDGVVNADRCQAVSCCRVPSHDGDGIGMTHQVGFRPLRAALQRADGWSTTPGVAWVEGRSRLQMHSRGEGQAAIS